LLRKLVFYAFALMLVGLATVVVSEYAVRVLFPGLNPSTQLVFYSSNPYEVPLGLPGVSYRHRHNAGDFDVEVRFNELGLRDTADVRGADADDWFFVGDSFGFGFGVDEGDRVSSVLNRAAVGGTRAQRGIVEHQRVQPEVLRGAEFQSDYAGLPGTQPEVLGGAEFQSAYAGLPGTQPEVLRGAEFQSDYAGLPGTQPEVLRGAEFQSDYAGLPGTQPEVLRGAEVSQGLAEEQRALPVFFNVSSPTHIEGYGRLLAMADGLVGHGGNPNPVLLLIFTGNDLFDYEAGVVAHTPFVSRFSRLKFYVGTQSALYQALRYLAWNAPGLRERLHQKAVQTAQEGHFVSFDPRVVESSARMAARILDEGERPHWVVLAPPKSLWTGRYRAEWAQFHYGFADALRERGLRVMDLAPALEQRALRDGVDSPLMFYFPTDGHWSAVGSAAVAEILIEEWADGTPWHR
jgi:hypothetical protein